MPLNLLNAYQVLEAPDSAKYSASAKLRETPFCNLLVTWVHAALYIVKNPFRLLCSHPIYPPQFSSSNAEESSSRFEQIINFRFAVPRLYLSSRATVYICFPVGSATVERRKLDPTHNYGFVSIVEYVRKHTIWRYKKYSSARSVFGA